MTRIIESMEASGGLAEDEPRVRRGPAPFILIAIGVAMFAFGSWYGLAVAPAEHYMGEIQRIMYVHVPTAWNAMLALGVRLRLRAMALLIKGGWNWDARLEAAPRSGRCSRSCSASRARSGPSRPGASGGTGIRG